MRTALVFTLALLAMVPVTQAATGSAETGNVTVDTRSDNADLSALTLSRGSLSPTRGSLLSPTFASGTTSYTASVSNAITSITLTPTRAEANATIEARVNGGSFSPVTSGSPSGSLALNVGTNLVEIRVTAQAGNTKTYTVTVTRFAAPTVTTPVTSFSRSLLPGGRQIFQFSLSGPRVVSLSTLGGAALRAELYDSEGNLITSFTGDANFDLEELLRAGDYELHVFRQEDGGLAQTFDLTIDASVVASSRPDVAVGISAGALTGNAIYSPVSQLSGLTSLKLRRVTGYASIANRGNLPDVLTGRATAGDAFFKVTYSDLTGNVTAGLLTGTYRTPELESGDAAVSILVSVSPNKRMLTKKKGTRTLIVKKSRTLTIKATSTFDPSIQDAASFRVQTK